MSNMKSFVGVVSALLFFGWNSIFFLLAVLQKYASDTRTSSSSTSLSQYTYYFFVCPVSFTFDCATIRDRAHFFFKCGKKLSTQIWLRCRFDFFSSVASFSILTSFLKSRRTIRAALHTDLIAMEDIHNNNLFFFTFFFFFHFSIHNSKQNNKNAVIAYYSKNFEYFSFIHVHKNVLGHWVAWRCSCLPSQQKRSRVKRIVHTMFDESRPIRMTFHCTCVCCSRSSIAVVVVVDVEHWLWVRKDKKK